jgi:hypothetical protein
MMMTGILFAAFIAVNAEVPICTNGVSDTARFVKTFECRDAKDVRRATWTVTGLGVFRAYGTSGARPQEEWKFDCGIVLFLRMV